jgi:hypothetical protein
VKTAKKRLDGSKRIRKLFTGTTKIVASDLNFSPCTKVRIIFPSDLWFHHQRRITGIYFWRGKTSAMMPESLKLECCLQDQAKICIGEAPSNEEVECILRSLNESRCATFTFLPVKFYCHIINIGSPPPPLSAPTPFLALVQKLKSTP